MQSHYNAGARLTVLVNIQEQHFRQTCVWMSGGSTFNSHRDTQLSFPLRKGEKNASADLKPFLGAPSVRWTELQTEGLCSYGSVSETCNAICCCCSGSHTHRFTVLTNTSFLLMLIIMLLKYTRPRTEAVTVAVTKLHY